MIKNLLSHNKKGMASLYVVIFVTILFGVITLSFIRIILSESIQSSNDDLSQSAYDSALAGVEDAKILVNKFYQCRSKTSSDSECTRLFGGVGTNARYNEIFGGYCDEFKLKKKLYGDADSEVKIEESSSNNSDQAYTCVIMKNIVPDYRSTLTSDTRTRVIPLGINSGQLGNVNRIRIAWYSEINGSANSFRLNQDNKLHVLSEATTPPTITATLLKTPGNFKIDDFNNSTSKDYSTMVLLPRAGSDRTTISKNELDQAGDSSSTNLPFEIHCGAGEFACQVDLIEPGLYQNGNAMLVLTMPYGDTITDFAVTLYDRNNNPIDFENVQISVDSTGRANQLYRRVETRLDPADIFFPYPEYEVELTGSDEESLRKNFWITANCWTEGGSCNNNGEM